MEIPVNRAYDLLNRKRHALSLRARTLCGLAREDVRSTSLTFDPDDFFACKACVIAYGDDGKGRVVF